MTIAGCSGRWNPRTDARSHERIIGDLIPYRNDGKAALRYAKGRENLSEYSGTCMDIRAGNLLISAEAGAANLRGLGLFVSEAHGGQGVAALSRAYEPS